MTAPPFRTFMNIPESWGYRADALVACLMASFALALGLYGCMATHLSHCVMPFVALFPVVEMTWWAWIGYNFWLRWHQGHFSHAAWNVAIALPLALLCAMSCLIHAPHMPVALASPLWPDRLFQKILLSLVWCWQQV